MDRFKVVAIIAVLALVLPWTAAANAGQGKGHGKAKGHDKADNQDDKDRDGDRPRRAATVTIFDSRDREIIGGYYRNRSSNLPPGLAKRHGNLPPGLEKQLQRNGTLPPGLQKRLEPFPQDLSRQLPPLPADYTRGVIGDRAIILNQRTRAIVDVIEIIMHPQGR
jgi:hypothetical protein